MSYKTIQADDAFDLVSRNVAFTYDYDNTVALIAFLAMHDDSRAGLLVDALVYAQQHDRYYNDDRIRNAYQGGDLGLPPGWTPHGKTGTVRMLFHITGNAAWSERAGHARQFVISLWDQVKDKFWTGTGSDGVTINKDTIPVDIQAWTLLAFKEEGAPHKGSLAYAEAHHKVGNDYDFNQEDKDGIWYEGTAQMAVAYIMTGQRAKADNIINFLRAAQESAGGINAADRDGLTTGFFFPGGVRGFTIKSSM